MAKLQAVEQQVQTIERDVAVDTADDSLTEQGDGSSTAAGDRYVLCPLIHQSVVSCFVLQNERKESVGNRTSGECSSSSPPFAPGLQCCSSYASDVG